MEDVRKLFEAKFPVPEGVHWYIDHYIGKPQDDHYANERHNAKFEGFRAAHELLAKDAERYRYLRNTKPWPLGLDLNLAGGERFDIAIDAAIAAQEHPKEGA